MRYPLLLAVAGAAAVAGVFTLSVWPGSTTPSPVAPVPREGDWLNRHTEFVALARRGDVSIVFFGDSLTDHWRDTGQAIWAKHFEPLGAVNFGIGSDGTQNVLWRVQNGELPPDGAEVVVLLIGTVNLNPPDARADDVADGVTAVVREIRRRSPRTRILASSLTMVHGECVSALRAEDITDASTMTKRPWRLRARIWCLSLPGWAVGRGRVLLR